LVVSFQGVSPLVLLEVLSVFEPPGGVLLGGVLLGGVLLGG
jgi:hypothetical protein